MGAEMAEIIRRSSKSRSGAMTTGIRGESMVQKRMDDTV